MRQFIRKNLYGILSVLIWGGVIVWLISTTFDSWLEEDVDYIVKTDDGKYKVYFNMKKIINEKNNTKMYEPISIGKLVRE